MPARPISRSEPGAAPCPALERVLQQQGYRELAAARIFAAGVLFAPTLDERQMFGAHSQDELAHFEIVSAAFERLARGDLHELVRTRADRVPVPADWPEAVVAALLFDLAVGAQVGTYRSSVDPSLRQLASSIGSDESDHLRGVEFALDAMCETGLVESGHLLPIEDAWVEVALESFDPLDTEVEPCRCGLHHGLRRGEPRFLSDARRILSVRGLLPPRLVAER